MACRRLTHDNPLRFRFVRARGHWDRSAGERADARHPHASWHGVVGGRSSRSPGRVSSCSSRSKARVTDTAGRFTLRATAQGSVTLVARHIGFAPASVVVPVDTTGVVR